MSTDTESKERKSFEEIIVEPYIPNLGRWAHLICSNCSDSGWCYKLNKKCIYNVHGE